ncbi:hypothetical protein [Pseudoalteromonas aurantia]|uniref:Uncharacterized protein n=1 Tax=Pseudoalteromonas aurantia TaxID=43654 RepID=A0A5S3UZ51_9GAMM|nr:hypothetical protein [Pseudoalteromonas aurantia]TMO62856.1 hypothetical protein CWC19_19845 [Pseudoalteromonas aurantia]
MAKSPNTELGTIECEGCGSFASIRRRANGKQLLYLHCKNCGLDQRSGAKLQAKWTKVISTETQQSQAIESEQQEVLNHNPAPDEWAPKTEQINSEIGAKLDDSDQRITSGITEDSDSTEHGKSGIWGWLGIAVVGAIAIATGTRLQSS